MRARERQAKQDKERMRKQNSQAKEEERSEEENLKTHKASWSTIGKANDPGSDAG